MRADPAKRLTILSDAEKLALYALPDFDEFQRAAYLALTEAELQLVQARRGTVEQAYCLLQLGYFKAKQAFFRFAWPEVPPEDLAFILSRYFPGVTLTRTRSARTSCMRNARPSPTISASGSGPPLTNPHWSRRPACGHGGM
jgi:hypothetical protein